MATFNKFNVFVEDICKGVHNLTNGNCVLKVALTLTAPVATNTVLANLTEIANGGGYTTGGISVGTITGSQSPAGTFKLVGGTDPQWTSDGSMADFRYAVLYNDTPTSPADPLIGWWDYGSTVALDVNGETFTVDLDQTNGILTVT